MFNKETEYAIRSLVYIQVQNKMNHRPGVIEIAKEIEAPQFYTAKILQRLGKSGLIKSTKGKGGGFYFDKHKPDVLLKDVIECTEGTLILTGCGFGLKLCDEKNPCPLHDLYFPIRDAISKLVNQETIQSLADNIVLKNAAYNRLNDQ